MGRGTVYNKFYTEEEWALVNKENKMIMEDYLEEYRQRKKKEGTINQYHNDLRIVFLYILRELNNKSILNLKKKDFRRFNLWLQDLGMSSARVNRLMSATRSMLSYVEDDDDYEYDNNIARKVHGLPKEAVRTNEDDFFLTFEQIMKLREELLKRNKLKFAMLLMICFDSAGRKNEVYQIKKSGLLEGNKTNIVIGKRGKKFPLVYLDDTKELIKQYLEERGEDNIESLWIVGKGDNKKEASIDSIYNWICEMSEILSELENKTIEFFPHSLRHSRVESLLMGSDTRLKDENGKVKKFSLEQVQKFCHHSDPKTTQSYAKDHSEDEIDDMMGI